jgi:hypothetical protein
MNGLSMKDTSRMTLKKVKGHSFYRMDKYIEGSSKMISLMEKDSSRTSEASLLEEFGSLELSI